MAAAVATTSRRGPGGGGRPIDDENLNFETSAGVEVIGSFDAMGIRDELLRGIYGYGFEKPSAIQQRAVLPIITSRDVVAQAQSGTGKTSMISLSVCQIVDTSVRDDITAGKGRAATTTTGEQGQGTQRRASWFPLYGHLHGFGEKNPQTLGCIEKKDGA